MKSAAKDVDEYISRAPKEIQDKLEEVRAAIKAAAPAALEGISYGMAFYDYKGWLAWFGLQKGYIGLYIRPPVIAEHKKLLAGYTVTKSAVHLPLNKKMPASLIKKLVRAGVKKNEASK